jgi:hypothetical protein
MQSAAFIGPEKVEEMSNNSARCGNPASADDICHGAATSHAPGRRARLRVCKGVLQRGHLAVDGRSLLLCPLQPLLKTEDVRRLLLHALPQKLQLLLPRLVLARLSLLP